MSAGERGITLGLLTLNAVASTGIAAVAWFAQGVRYPALRRTPPGELPEAASAHGRHMAPIVVPLMLSGAAAGTVLALRPPPSVGRALPLASLGLSASAWASTAAVQAPQHARLRARHDAATLDALVRWNLPRTLAWTLAALVSTAMLARGARANPGQP